MDDLKPIGAAATATGISRITIRRWINAGRLKETPGIIDRRPVVLVSLDAIRKLKTARPAPGGRPKKA